jgi:hypothetical protein
LWQCFDGERSVGLGIRIGHQTGSTRVGRVPSITSPHLSRPSQRSKPIEAAAPARAQPRQQRPQPSRRPTPSRARQPLPALTNDDRALLQLSTDAQHKSARDRSGSTSLTRSPRRGACGSRVCSACSKHRSGYRSSHVMLRATESARAGPTTNTTADRTFDTRNHFHPSRVDEVHEVLRRSFKSPVRTTPHRTTVDQGLVGSMSLLCRVAARSRRTWRGQQVDARGREPGCRYRVFPSCCPYRPYGQDDRDQNDQDR